MKTKISWVIALVALLSMMALAHAAAPKCTELAGRVDAADGALLASCQ